MAIKYYVRKTASLITRAEDGTAKNETRYYAQSLIDESIDQQTIVDRIVEKSSLSEGDVISCITELFKEMTAEMLEGHSVKLNNFGTFYITLKSKSQETPEQVTADCIESCHLTFRPATRWYETIKPRARFQKVAAPVKETKKEEDGSAAGGESSRGEGGDGGSLEM